MAKTNRQAISVDELLTATEGKAYVSREDFLAAFYSENNSPYHTPPRWIPRDQLYYWTPEWQEGEKQTDEDLAAGNYKDFANAEDAIEWLLDDEEDDA